MLSSEIKIRPLFDNDEDYEAIERLIKKVLKSEIYLPIIKELGAKTSVLKNSREKLLLAIKDGRIEFRSGEFTGRFNATISKEIRALGARWDRKTGTFKLPQSSLPIDVRNAISASESYFQTKFAAIDRLLANILPEQIADKIKISDHFDSVLWKVDKQLHGTLKKITITPTLSPSQKKRIADEYQNNMQLYIKNWTEKEIVKLRKDVQASVFSGERNESRAKVALKVIGDSYDSSIKKAKFLARQETRLLLTKYKQSRYEDAGVEWYEWGISNHAIQPKGAKYLPGEVRHDHGRLAGKYFKWNDSPITDDRTGARNNPGQDFNCRCFAVPVVRPKGNIKHGFGCTYMEKK